MSCLFILWAYDLSLLENLSGGIEMREREKRWKKGKLAIEFTQQDQRKNICLIYFNISCSLVYTSKTLLRRSLCESVMPQMYIIQQKKMWRLLGKLNKKLVSIVWLILPQICNFSCFNLRRYIRSHFVLRSLCFHLH